MRYLNLSLLFLITSCASYPEKRGFTPSVGIPFEAQNVFFANENLDYLYKASIEVYNKSFGGILIIKKIEENHHRVVFTTEMGNKIFDFSLQPNSFQVNYIMEEMDKKHLINVLKTDFRALVTENFPVNEYFMSAGNPVVKAELEDRTFYYFYKGDELEKIKQTKGTKEKIEFIFSEINDNIARQILIVHHSIDLTIELTSIITNE